MFDADQTGLWILLGVSLVGFPAIISWYLLKKKDSRGWAFATIFSTFLLMGLPIGLIGLWVTRLPRGHDQPCPHCGTQCRPIEKIAWDPYTGSNQSSRISSWGQILATALIMVELISLGIWLLTRIKFSLEYLCALILAIVGVTYVILYLGISLIQEAARNIRSFHQELYLEGWLYQCTQCKWYWDMIDKTDQSASTVDLNMTIERDGTGSQLHGKRKKVRPTWVSCPNCGDEYSSEELRCPECKRENPARWGCFLVIFVLLLAFTAFGFNAAKTTGTTFWIIATVVIAGATGFYIFRTLRAYTMFRALRRGTLVIPPMPPFKVKAKPPVSREPERVQPPLPTPTLVEQVRENLNALVCPNCNAIYASSQIECKNCKYPHPKEWQFLVISFLVSGSLAIPLLYLYYHLENFIWKNLTLIVGMFLGLLACRFAYQIVQILKVLPAYLSRERVKRGWRQQLEVQCKDQTQQEFTSVPIVSSLPPGESETSLASSANSSCNSPQEPAVESVSGAPRTFRIFVSSTFSDLKAERNALQERVYPRLRELCQQHGTRFQAVDLRWGVTEEATLDQQTMNICLGEIARCQQITPRPNFIVLLGDRYGWCPPPPSIPAAEFEQIVKVINNDADRSFLKEWYRLDKNAVPPEWLLKPRQRGSAYEDQARWLPVESRLHSILAAATSRLDLPREQRLRYTASATEQEINAGISGSKDAAEHTFCFFRSISGLPQELEPAAGEYADLQQSPPIRDTDASQKLINLKEWLATCLPGHIFNYQARWTGNGITSDHIDQLCEDVYQSLSSIILDEIKHPHPIDPTPSGTPHIQSDDVLDEEGLAHLTFAEERLRFFVGRQEALLKITRYLSDDQHRILAITGAGGVGKTALVAQAIYQIKQQPIATQIVYRFIGATRASSDGVALLRSLCREIALRYTKDETEIPTEFSDLVTTFEEFLSLASETRPLILFLDSLDQLSGQDARSLTWLPDKLPEHVHVIVSTRIGDTWEALMVKQVQQLEVGGLSRPEGEALLLQWLASIHRNLQPAQCQYVLDRFEQSQGNPLYLKLAFEEARLWLSGSGHPPEQLATGISGIIQKNMMERLAEEGHHGRVLAAHAMGYLAASRYGLSEEELVDLLSRDRQVYKWFLQSSYQLPPDLILCAAEYLCNYPPQSTQGKNFILPDKNAAVLNWLTGVCSSQEQLEDFLAEVLPKANGPRLPMVLWSRLYADLSPYLTERLVEKTPLLGFYHREMEDAARNIYLEQTVEWPCHCLMADYFRSRADPRADRSWIGHHPHGLSELPFHLSRAGRYQELEELLTDFSFLTQKASEVGVVERKDKQGSKVLVYTGVLHLLGDMQLVLPHGSHSPLLVSFSRALSQEAHILLSQPQLLWQQFYNRLQWDHRIQETLSEELAKRCTPGSQPWFKAEIPIPESQALIRTLTGHNGSVHSCAFSPDGLLIVSAGEDKLLKVWKRVTGEELFTLAGHTREVLDCLFSPDGRFIVSASADKTLRVWEAASHATLLILKGHKDCVNACAISPDGRLLVSVSVDKTLRVWDIDTGRLVHKMEGFTSEINACAFSPDGQLLVAGGWDKLKVYNSTSWRLKQELKLNAEVTACVFSPDGNHILAGLNDGRLQIWDASSGQELESLIGEGDRITACAYSPDGSHIVAAYEKTGLAILDAITGDKIHTLGGSVTRANDCRFSTDGKWIISACVDNTVLVWDFALIKEQTTVQEHFSNLQAFTPSQDRTLIVTCLSNELIVWNATTGKLLQTLRGHKNRVYVCSFSPDGQFLVSASNYKTLYIWDTATGKKLHILKGDCEHILDCAFSPDGRLIASLDQGSNHYQDYTYHIWDTTTGLKLRRLDGHCKAVLAFSFSPDMRFFVTASADKTLEVMDAVTGQPLHILIGHTGAVIDCAFSPDGRYIVSCSADRTLRVWDSVSGQACHRLDCYPDYVSAFTFSPDGQSILIVRSRATSLWDSVTGNLLSTLKTHSEAAAKYFFSPDGRFIISANGKNLQVWRSSNGELVASLPFRDTLGELVVHPTQPKIVCGIVGEKIFQVELMNIEWGPILMTAIEEDHGFSVRCPACQNIIPIEKEQLGSVIHCPNPGCEAALQLNHITRLSLQ